MTDPIKDAAQFLVEHLEYVRHQRWADEFLADVNAAARVLRSVARGPVERVYLGPCGAAEQVDITTFADLTVGRRAYVDGAPCEGDVYGLPGGEKGTCRTCGAQVSQAERRAWLDEQVADRAYRAAHIADAYRINVKTIRSWADRGRLAQHGHDGDGRPLYLVGDVLDLARQAAAHRAENEAKRAARQAAEVGG